MMNSCFPKTLLTLILTVTLASASTASAQTPWSWRLYDLRDLLGLLPPSPRVDADVLAAPAITIADAEPRPCRPGPVDELMDRLCGALGVNRTALFPGVYGIEADEETHTTLLSMLEQVRRLYAERYEVEVLWFAASPDQTPSIGDPVVPVEPVHRHRFVVARRAPTQLAQVSRHAYVYSIQPVVAQQAVGYGPEVKREEGGLRLSIWVGAGSETETATSIQVRGELRRVSMGKLSGPLITDVEQSMGIELPEVSVRSIQSNVAVEYGELTTLAVVDGFDDGGGIVLAASVRKLSD